MASSSSFRGPAALIEGAVLSGDALRAYAQHKGLCPLCGVTKTHTKAGNWLSKTWKPVTTTNDQGEYSVYKGYCLQPTCNTLQRAQELLGEKKPKRSRRGPRMSLVQGSSKLLSARSLLSRSSFGSGSRRQCTPQSSGDLTPVVSRTSSRRRSTITPQNSGDLMPAVESMIEESKLEADDTPLLQEIEAAGLTGDLDKIWEILTSSTSSGKVMRSACRILRQMVSQAYDMDPETTILADRQEDTVAMIAELRRFRMEPAVIIDAALAWNSLVARSTPTAQTLISNGGLMWLREHLETQTENESLAEVLCASLRCLAAVAVHAGIEPRFIDATTKTLVSQLRCTKSIRPEHALCGLSHFASSGKRWSHMRHHISQPGVVQYLWDTLAADSTSEQVAEAIMHLIWRLWTDEGDEPISATKRNLLATLAQLEDGEQPTTHASALRLLGSIALDIEAASVPHVAEHIVSAVLDSLKSHPNDRMVSVNGVAALYSLLHDADDEFLAPQLLEDLVDTVVVEMKKAPNCIVQQALACQILAVFLNWSDEPHRIVMDRGAPKAVLTAFQSLALGGRDRETIEPAVCASAVLAALINFSADPNSRKAFALPSTIIAIDQAIKSANDSCDAATLVRFFNNLAPSLRIRDDVASSAKRVRVRIVKSATELIEGCLDDGEVVQECCHLLRFFHQQPKDACGPPTVSLNVDSTELLAPINIHREYSVTLQALRSQSDKPTEHVVANHLRYLIASMDMASTEYTEALFPDTMDALVDKMHADAESDQMHLEALFADASLHCPADVLDRVAHRMLQRLDPEDPETPCSSSLGNCLVVLARQGAALWSDGEEKNFAKLCVAALATDSEYASAFADLTLLFTESDAGAIAFAESEESLGTLVHRFNDHQGRPEVFRQLSRAVQIIVSLERNEANKTLVREGAIALLSNVLGRSAGDPIEVLATSNALLVLLPEAGFGPAVNTAHLQAVIEHVLDEPQPMETKEALAKLLRALFDMGIANSVAPSLARLLDNPDATPESALIHAIIFSMLRKIAATDIAQLNAPMFSNQILNGMLLHADSVELVTDGMAVLTKLAVQTSELLHQAQAIEIVTCLMRIHIFQPTVLAEGFAALNNIVVDTERRTVRRVPEEIVDLVVVVAQRYPVEDRLQKHACLLLKSLLYSHAALKSMQQRSETLIPLLIAAAENFPTECGDRAQSIMFRL